MNAQNPDLNALRAAAKARMRAPARSSSGSQTGKGSTVVRTAVAGLLLTAALVLTVTAAALSRLWIGDHAVSHGQPWPALRSIGITANRISPLRAQVYLTALETKMLIWLLIIAVAAVALRRSLVAVGLAILMGVVYGHWWVSWPSITPPAAVSDLIGRQATAATGAGVWTWLLACGAALLVARLAARARG